MSLHDAVNRSWAIAGERTKAGTSTSIESMMPSPGWVGPATGTSEEPKDRGKEPQREKAEYPWFWGWDEEKQDFAGGRDFTGDRWNDCHYTNEFKKKAKE